MASETTVIIEAKPQRLPARLIALWRYRSFYGFLFREITTRKTRDTLLGFWWLIIRPGIPATVFIITFTFVHPLDSGGALPYPLFFLSGFITWNVFQSTVIFLPRTLMWMQGIMRRTYFPRLLVPLAGVGPAAVEFLVLSTLFIGLVGVYWVSDSQLPLRLGWQMLWLLPCLVAALMFGIALGMVTSVVALFSRDVVYSVGYFAQMFMFVTPVVYPVSFVPESYHWLLYTLNPMAKIVEVSRWALTGQGELDPPFLILSIGMILATFIAAVLFFLRAETYLADQM
jgi:lipopolysaccharide transport system permease protein